MAGEDATFKVKVIDESTAAALQIRGSLKLVEAQLRSLDRAAARSKGEDALKRFGLAEKRTDLRAQLRGQEQALRTSAMQQRKAARTSAQAAAKEKARADKQGLDIGRFAPNLGEMVMGGGPAGFVATGLAIGTTAAFALAAALGAVAVKFGELSLDAAAFGQDAKLAMGALTGSSVVATREFDLIRFEAVRLGQDVRESVNNFRKLLSAQFDVPMAEELFRMSADLKVAGANVDKAILAISQIKMKGFLQGEELTGQLAEAGVSAELVYQALEKQLGKTRKQVLAMQRNREITADVAIQAILQAAKKKTGVEEFGELAAKRAELTISGMRDRLAAKWDNMFLDIGEAITPVLAKIGPKIFSLFDTIVENPKVQALGVFMLEQFNRFADWIVQNWPKIEQAVSSGAGKIADALLLFGQGVQFVGDHWDFFGPVLEGGIALLEAAFITTQIMAAPFIAFGLAVAGAATEFMFLVGVLREQGAAIMEGLVDGITSKIEEVREAMNEVLDIIKSTLPDALQMHSPSKLFEDFGENTVLGYVRGVNDNADAVQGATAGMAFDAIGGAGAAAAAPGGRAPIEVNFTQNVYAMPGMSVEDVARLSASEAEKALRRVLEEYEAA